MINNNIKIYCNDEPVLTLCNVYDNNTPISIEKLTSLAEFETMHNAKADAHKNIIDNIKTTLLNKAEKAEIPKKISELENDNNYITQEESSQQNANIDLSNLSQEGLNIIQTNSGGGLEIGDIGIAPLGIDETLGKRRYLNGQVIIQEQYQVFSDKVKSAIVLYPNLACSEEDWQATATLSAFGQCGKFVVDDEAGTIRLPKITGFIQGLADLASLGSLVEAGLPNITGNIYSDGYWGGSSIVKGSSSGAIRTNTTTQNKGNAQGASTSGTGADGVNFDASRSSSIYGNSDTVQPESIRYPYFIQVATGSDVEVDILNEIELNNPYTLFDSKYTEAELFNASWLKSNGQYNSGSIYVSAYQALLIENNADIEIGTTVNNYTKRGLSVKLSTETYTDFDFVLNTSDATFRLPISVSNTGQGYLYFYVGETVQNANLINAGRIEEKLSDCITRDDCKAYIVETYRNGTSWYNVYSNDWCEQGGIITAPTNPHTITFIKTYVSLPTVVAQSTTTGTNPDGTLNISSLTESGFVKYDVSRACNGFSWVAYGYIR